MTPSRPTRSATQRGLGWAHQQHRAALMRAHLDGTPCPCTDCGPACPCRAAGLPPGQGLPMFREPTWNADHMPLEADHGALARSHGGTRADRLLIATCNRSRGNGTRGPSTPNTTAIKHWSREW